WGESQHGGILTEFKEFKELNRQMVSLALRGCDRRLTLPPRTSRKSCSIPSILSDTGCVPDIPKSTQDDVAISRAFRVSVAIICATVGVLGFGFLIWWSADNRKRA